MVVFLVYPTGSVLVKSLTVEGSLSSGNYLAVLKQPHLFRKVWSSLLVSGGSAVFSTLLGLIFAMTVIKTTMPLRRTFTAAAVIPMIIPGFVTTLSYVFLFGRNGLITYKCLNLDWDIFSWKSVMILQSMGFTTTTFLIIIAVLVGVDSQVEEAARNLGASEWKVLTTVTLPLIRPGILSALLLAFLRAMADFGTPYIIGGRFDTLASASYSQLIGNYNMEMAATLNVVLLLFCLTIFFVYTAIQGKGVRQAVSVDRKPLQLPEPVKAVMWGVCLLFTLATALLSTAVLLAAFTRHLGADFSPTLEHFRILPQRGWNSIRNTLLFASVTSIIMSLAGITIAYLVSRLEFIGRRTLDFLVTIPFAIPGTFIGVGYALAFSHPPLVMSGTWAIIVSCTVIRELPLGVRAGTSVLAQQDRSIEEASSSLGSSRAGTFFRIVLPLARPALLVSAIYAFVSTVKTLGAIIFLITPANKVLAADVFEAVVRGDVGQAAAMSIVMILVSGAGVLTIFTINRRESTREWIQRVLRNRVPR
jgi:iron(III) transport system permease protein